MKRFIKSYEGYFLILTAILIPVIILGVGSALDISRMMYGYSTLKEAGNTAVLSGAEDLLFKPGKTIDQEKDVIRWYIASQLLEALFTKKEAVEVAKDSIIEIEISDDFYRVEIKPTYKMPLSSFSLMPYILRADLVELSTDSEAIARDVKKSEEDERKREETFTVAVIIENSRESLENLPGNHQSKLDIIRMFLPDFFRKIGEVQDPKKNVRAGFVQYSKYEIHNSGMEFYAPMSWGVDTAIQNVNRMVYHYGTNELHDAGLRSAHWIMTEEEPDARYRSDSPNKKLFSKFVVFIETGGDTTYVGPGHQDPKNIFSCDRYSVPSTYPTGETPNLEDATVFNIYLDNKGKNVQFALDKCLKHKNDSYDVDSAEELQEVFDDIASKIVYNKPSINKSHLKEGKSVVLVK